MVVIHMSLGACVHVSNAKRSVESGDSIANMQMIADLRKDIKSSPKRELLPVKSA